ncbi:MAG: hypothetical protein KDK39_19760, partial [Leptospiraceae bacterium]|nr:hypothetical protein [Leptospiraceae bacterium]
RHSESGHDIHGGDPGISFGRLGIKAVLVEFIAKQGFDPKHRRFGQTAPMIAAGLFPARVAVFLGTD